MAFTLLEHIANGRLPMTFEREEEIALVESLSTAGYVRVRFSWIGGQRRAATVTELTRLGELAMRHCFAASSRPELKDDLRHRLRASSEFASLCLLALMLSTVLILGTSDAELARCPETEAVVS